MPLLRDPQLIRTNAIKMGIKKAQQGCIECAAHYFKLAKQYGATPIEFRQNVDRLYSPLEDSKFGRRDLLKLVAAAGTVGALSVIENFAVQAQQAFATPALSMPTWWGTDSNTQSGYGIPQNFYIGRMGYGIQPKGDGNFFNINAAHQAGHDRTYGYWVLDGPGSKPNNLSAYSWGQKQASCAWEAWHSGPHSSNIGGQTIFADIEAGGGGWQNGNDKPNQEVLEGFLQECFRLAQSKIWPGVYVSPSIWTNFFGQNFRPSLSFVLWLTGFQTCISSICAPCNVKCNTLIGVRTHLASGVANVTVGGQKPVLWQYWIGSCGCGDYNVMMQNATALVPAQGHTHNSTAPLPIQSHTHNSTTPVHTKYHKNKKHTKNTKKHK